MRAVIIDEKDNVAVVVQETQKGDCLETGAEKLTANEYIKTGHKIARCDIKKGDPVIKYGIIIGEASADIKKGDWVHCHNVLDTTEKICDAYAADYRAKVKEAQGK
ncbi:MAG: UxaA family hydrolase [Clostridiales bacterium]|nr:UxaA family hydrolase [Clostridiales bacterium]